MSCGLGGLKELHCKPRGSAQYGLITRAASLTNLTLPAALRKPSTRTSRAV